MHFAEFGYLDANADLVTTVMVWEQSDMYVSMDPKLSVFDEYIKTHQDQNIVIIRMQPHGKDFFYTYALSDEADEKIYTSGELFELMAGTDLPFVPYPEAKKQLDELRGKSADADPVEWMEIK